MDVPPVSRRDLGHPWATVSDPICDWGYCSTVARVMAGEGEEWTRSFRHDTTVRRHSVGRDSAVWVSSYFRSHSWRGDRNSSESVLSTNDIGKSHTFLGCVRALVVVVGKPPTFL